MKITLTVFVVCLTAMTSLGQRAAPDKIPTSKGDLTIQPVMHAALMLQWNGQTIYVDPSGDAKAYAGLDDPDIVLITDVHGDHMSVETLEGLNTKSAVMVVPQAVADKLPESYKERLMILGNGDETRIGEISIRAIPMYNLPDDETSRHTKGRGNGYIVEMGGKRIYISGDTEDIPEMRRLKNIDVAFVCMNLPYTMDINQAASAVLEFQPAIVYPYHYRGQGGLADVEGFKQLVDKGGKKIEVRLRNWYPGL